MKYISLFQEKIIPHSSGSVQLPEKGNSVKIHLNCIKFHEPVLFSSVVGLF